MRRDIDIRGASIQRALVNLLIICALVICCAGMGWAVLVPAYDRLQPVTENLAAPTAVALDKFECIFIAESVNNRVLIFSQSGQFIDSIEGLNRPVSVAVDDDVRIYVGNKGAGNVEVYDASLNYLYKLGKGDGEFIQPNDIEITDSGVIYVVDKGAGRVKIYNADGSYRASFGGPGSGNGKFHKPVSLAFDTAAGELLVLDHQLSTDMFGKSIEGARVQVFDMNGIYRRGFSPYGNQVGQLFRPQHLTVDKQSRVYVTDSFHNVVLVYDGFGAYLGDLYNIENPLRTPLGITVGGSNRLYIASLSTGRVEVYGLDLYTNMYVSPSQISFAGAHNSSSPPVQNIEIGNSGTADLNWSARADAGWMSLSSTAGVLKPGQTASVDVGVVLQGMAAGLHTGIITISDAKGAAEAVTVLLEVQNPPELAVYPSSLTFTSINGSEPQAQSLSVANTGDGTLIWSVVKDRSWIQTGTSGGMAPDSLEVIVDVTGLNPGTYSGSIIITGQGAQSSPAAIPVTLNILTRTGTIQVTSNRSDAAYTISGAQSFSGSGSSWSASGAAAGTYTVMFDDISGFITPTSQMGVLDDGATINFHGEYIVDSAQAMNGSSIIVGAGPGPENSGIVKVLNADGTETGLEFMAHGYKYGVNVAAGDINCDDIDEIITAPGPGPDNPSEIRIYNSSGKELTNLRIAADQYRYGAHVASGDVNGDGDYEVIAGAGPGVANPAEVRVYVYNAAAGHMADSGVRLTAYSSGYGVRVAAGDIDGDGLDEIITAPGPGPDNGGTVRVWKVDFSAGIGNWTAEMVKQIDVSSVTAFSVSVAGGDIDGDGIAEVIAGSGPDPSGQDTVRVYDSFGSVISQFDAAIEGEYGVNASSGDMDGDGVEEIIAGAGPGVGNSAVVAIFDANGVELGSISALDTFYGVNVAVGKLGF